MAGKQKILIVDDDEDTAELTSLCLEKEYFETHTTPDGAAAPSLFHSFSLGLVLPDLMLPYVDDYQVCRGIRESAQALVIMLSAKGGVFDRVLGLKLGAGNYIMKSFEPKELVVCVRTALRRYRSQEAAPPTRTDTSVVHCRGLEISLTNYAVRYEGHPVEMPPKELGLLCFIASYPSQVFTREQFLGHTWDYEYAGDIRTVDVHTKRLREKLRDKSS